ncbi:MAG TPA: ABC transporter permease [Hyphomicrobiales bacterium]|nr:ABC transporter permease [Hyphomicrobiales bacterium]
MLKSYLKTALNFLMKHKLHSMLNLLGMAVALACCLLVSLYVLFELSYDRHHQLAERLYRISGDFASAQSVSNSGLAAALLKEEFPQIVETARIYGDQPGLLRRGELSAFEPGVRFADNSFFRLMDYEWLQGNPETALTQPDTIVLTESLADKYFPGENPMGQILELGAQRLPMTVVGVIRDLPDNTHLFITAIGSLDLGVKRSSYTEDYVLRNWGFNIFHTYILLEEGARIEDIEQRLPDFVSRHVPATGPTPRGMSALNIRDIHLQSTMRGEWKPVGNPDALLILGIIAVCVLIVACVNFMNLSTARSAQRAREIGLRKAMGADRGRIIVQFLGESIFMTTLAMVMAIALLELVLPAFREFVGIDVDWSSISGASLLLGMVAFVAFVGIAAGSYAAFFVSSFQASRVLKGDVTRGNAGVLFRNILVLGQFSISITLIIATAVVLLQMNFARKADLGFNTEQVVLVQGDLATGLGPRREEMLNRLRQHPNVINAAASSINPLAAIASLRRDVIPEGETEAVDIYGYPVGPNFLETFAIGLSAGRTFSSDRTADQYVAPTAETPLTQASFVLNEFAARQFGWTADEALGKSLKTPDKEGIVEGTVIGVVKDAYLESVREPIKPLMFYMPPEYSNGTQSVYSRLSIKIRGDDIPETLAFIDSTWKAFNPSVDIRRDFLDSEFDAVYRDEQQQGRMFLYFASLAIVLACFGLFGLAAYNTERRTREIGIRKAIGGNVGSIVYLLTKDFSKLVLLANLIAWPIAYVSMSRWLDNFAYRIDLSPLVFIGSGVVALCIAWLTVGGTAAKAASAKPVLALRCE